MSLRWPVPAVGALAPSSPHRSTRLGVGLPRFIATLNHLFEYLLVSEVIHCSPDPIILVGHQLSRLNEAVERLNDQFIAFFDIMEDFTSEDEEAAIDPDVGFLACPDSPHDPLFVKLSEMKVDRRVNGDEARHLPAPFAAIDHVRDGAVCQAIAI